MPYNEPLMILLAQKKELIFQMLRMANDVDFNEPNTENAEKFIEFVENREEIVEKLKIVSDEIEKLREACGESREASLFDYEINDMAAQIKRLELDVSQKTLGIINFLQKEIRDMNNRKRVSGIYEAKGYVTSIEPSDIKIYNS